MKQNSHCLFFGSPRTGMSIQPILSIPDYSHLSESEKENMAKAILDNCIQPILSIPDYSHLSESEKENMAKAILDNCKVKIIFRTNEPTPLVNKEGAND